jgi:hypothetical protein
MKLAFVSTIVVLLTIGGCTTDPGPRFGPPAVTLLPGIFVSPESCARAAGAWLVSDKGCAPFQPCWVDATSRAGKVYSVADGNGARTTLLDGLASPNGVAVDGDRNVWVVDGKTGEVLVRTPDGRVVKRHVDGAGLLNDVMAAPWAPATVLVSDTKKGEILIAALDGDEIVTSVYVALDGAPNGLAPTPSDDGVVVVGLGDLAVPGRAGLVYTVEPEVGEDCSLWHGGKKSTSTIAAPKGRKLDGIVRYIVSSIIDTTQVDENKMLDGKLWFVAPGAEPVLLFDLTKADAGGGVHAASAADIGLDAATRTLCVPDLNGSNELHGNGQAGAHVFLVTDL